MRNTDSTQAEIAAANRISKVVKEDITSHGVVARVVNILRDMDLLPIHTTQPKGPSEAFADAMRHLLTPATPPEHTQAYWLQQLLKPRLTVRATKALRRLCYTNHLATVRLSSLDEDMLLETRGCGDVTTLEILKIAEKYPHAIYHHQEGLKL